MFARLLAEAVPRTEDALPYSRRGFSCTGAPENAFGAAGAVLRAFGDAFDVAGAVLLAFEDASRTIEGCF